MTGVVIDTQTTSVVSVGVGVGVGVGVADVKTSSRPAFTLGVAHVLETRTFILGQNFRKERTVGSQDAYQFTIKATSFAIEFAVEATTPRKCIYGTTLGLDTSRSGMGSGEIASETRAGDVGGPGILHLDAQEGPLVHPGIDSGEGWELIHGRRKRRRATLKRRAGVIGVSAHPDWLYADILGPEVFVEAGGQWKDWHGREWDGAGHEDRSHWRR